MTVDAFVAVQRHALERALVDDVDARRYFALAGTLDIVRQDPAHPPAAGEDEPPSRSGRELETLDEFDATVDSGGVLPAALLSLVVVSQLDDASPVSLTADPWTPGGDTTRPAVRRGARLALRWFDVPADRVAARAGLPEAVLVSPDE